MSGWLVLTVAALGSLAAAGQQTRRPSLAGVAEETAEHRQDATEPSRVFTNEDLHRVAVPVAADGAADATDADVPCTEEENDDRTTGNHFAISRCEDGTTRVSASNPDTGARWRWTEFPDGSQQGTDRCGVDWTYDAGTTEYHNTAGESLVGEDAFRARLQKPTRCE